MQNINTNFVCKILYTISAIFIIAHSQGANAKLSKPANLPASIYDITVEDINGKALPLAQFKGKVLMIVNTASKCGFTPQFKDLVELQAQYGSQGFQILAFPSNDFRQDEGSSKDSEEFAQKNYQINFPILNKGHVGGDNTHILYQYLNQKGPGFPAVVMWNFEKFLIDRNGQVVERFRSLTKPSAPEVKSKIESLLKTKP